MLPVFPCRAAAELVYCIDSLQETQGYHELETGCDEKKMAEKACVFRNTFVDLSLLRAFPIFPTRALTFDPVIFYTQSYNQFIVFQTP